MTSNRIIRSILALLLVVSIAAGLFACAPRPSEDTFKEAQKKEVDAIVEKINTTLDKSTERDPRDMTSSVSLGITLSDEALSLLRSYTSEDLSWINDARFNITGINKNNRTSTEVALSYQGKDILSVEGYIDAATQNIYMNIPQLTDTFYLTSLESVDLTEMADFIYTSDTSVYIPDTEAVASLVNEIYEIVMDDVEDIEFEDDTLKVNGVEQKCTKYETELSQKDVFKITRKLLEEFRDNKDIKDYLYEIISYTADPSNPDTEAADLVYEDYVDSIDSAIADIDEALEEEGISKKTALEWTSYVDKKSLDVIGTELKFVDEENDTSYTVFFGRTTDGEEIGFELSGGTKGEEKDFEILGELTEEKGLRSGTYEVMVRGESILFIDIDDVDIESLDAGYFNGTVKLSPSSGLVDMITSSTGSSSIGSGLAIASFALKLDIEQTEKTANVKATLLNSGTPYVTVNMKSTVSEGESFTLPTTITTDEYAWVESFDFDALSTTVSESGLPDYVVTAVTELINELQNGGYNNDDYYSGYEDGYYSGYWDGYYGESYYCNPYGSSSYEDGYRAGYDSGYLAGYYGY